ncbi:MAG: hypothetical protein Q8L52_03655 [bacterium]|nr:hypothetical protein [bacterium]
MKKFEDRSLTAASLRVAKECAISQETAKILLKDTQRRIELEELGFSRESIGTLDFDFTRRVAGPTQTQILPPRSDSN